MMRVSIHYYVVLFCFLCGIINGPARADPISFILPEMDGFHSGDRLQIALSSNFTDMKLNQVVKAFPTTVELPVDAIYHWRLLSETSGKIKSAGSFLLMGPDKGPYQGFVLSWNPTSATQRTRIRIFQDGKRKVTLTTQSTQILVARFATPVIVSVLDANLKARAISKVVPSLQAQAVDLRSTGKTGEYGLYIGFDKAAKPVVQTTEASTKVEKVDEDDVEYDKTDQEYPWEQEDVLAHDRKQNFGFSQRSVETKKVPELPRQSQLGLFGVLSREASTIKREDEYKVSGAMVMGPGFEILAYPDDLISIHIWGDSHGTNNDYGDTGIDRPSSEQKRMQGYGSIALDLLNLFKKDEFQSIALELTTGTAMIPIATDNQRIPMRGGGVSWMKFKPDGAPSMRLELSYLRKAGHVLRYTWYQPQLWQLKSLTGMVFGMERQTKGDLPGATSQFMELGVGAGLLYAL